MTDLSLGAIKILLERHRQQREEGYLDNHDDEHVKGELAIAAACYALQGTDLKVIDPSHVENLYNNDVDFDDIIKEFDAWPFEKASDKRGVHSYRRCLEIAGALIAAEIDRVDRKIREEAKIKDASDFIREFVTHF